MRVSFPQNSCEHPLGYQKCKVKKKMAGALMALDWIHNQRLRLIRGWTNGSKTFRASGHARPKPPFQIAKWVKVQKPSMAEMRSQLDLRSRSISKTILVQVKSQFQITKEEQRLQRSMVEKIKRRDLRPRFILQCGLASLNTKFSHCEE